MVSASASPIDRRQVRRNFDRAAKDYDAVAVFQREISRRMLERLDFVKIEPEWILDLGCGTAFDLSAISERYRKARVIGMDQSEAMLRAGESVRSQMRWSLPFLKANKAALICADAQALPIRNNSVGFVWSNLLLHWVDDVAKVLREAHRVLEVEGLLMFSVLGPDSFKELRSSFADTYEHTLPFGDLHDYGDLLLECGFSDPVMDVDRITMHYQSLDDLLTELKRNGGSCATQGRCKGMFGKNAWQAMKTAYEEKAQGGIFPVSLEVVYGHAWKGELRKIEDGRNVIHFEKTDKR